MSKDYNGDEKRSQVNGAMRILINIQEQTHTCVKDLGKDVRQNTSLVIANGVKLDAAIEYNKECDKRLTGVELWKAGHTGEGVGKKKFSNSVGGKITLVCTIGAFIFAAIAFYYTSIKPTLERSIGAYDKIAAIEQKYQELLKP